MILLNSTIFVAKSNQLHCNIFTWVPSMAVRPNELVLIGQLGNLCYANGLVQNVDDIRDVVFSKFICATHIQNV